MLKWNGIYYKQYLRWNGSGWSYAGWSGGSGIGNASNASGEISYVTLVNNSEIISASKDIYTDNTFTEVFFQLTPPETEVETEKAILVEIAGQVTEQAQAEIVPTILKVIVTTVGLVVFLIALKKGFRTLVIGLRT